MRELSEIDAGFRDKEYAHAYVEELLNIYIATQIKVLREQREWSQEELARHAEMKQARISLLENADYGSWSISTLKRLANAFDLALRVSFESFGTALWEMRGLSRSRLERTSRMDELRGQDVVADSAIIVDLRKYAKSRNAQQRRKSQETSTRH
jgi:transcriptional regulator with XRE-family HTH domain